MRHTLTHLFIAGLLMLLMTSCHTAVKADLIVLGNIYTANANDAMAEAFAVKDGKYIFVGDARKAKSYKGRNTEMLYCDTACLVTPGFTDGHAHRFFVVKDSPENPTSLFSASDTHRDILRKIACHITANPDIPYLLTWASLSAKDIVFDRLELDSLFTTIPVCILDMDGHVGFFNTLALQNALGPGKMYSHEVNDRLIDTKFIPGGEFGRYDDDGRGHGTMNGCITEEAMYYVIHQNVKPNSDILSFKSSITKACDDLHAMGYTNYVDALTNSYTTDFPWRAIKELDEAGGLKMNVISNYDVFAWDKDIEGTLDGAANLRDKYKTRHFNPVNIQFFIDGTPQAATALIDSPYHNVKGKGDNYRGMQIWSDSCLHHLVYEANKRGLICHPHTMGDMAVHKVLGAYVYANRLLGRKTRNNIVHVRNILREDIRTAADNDIAVVGGFFLHTNSMNGNGRWISFCDSTYAYGGYPLKSVINGGAILSCHSETFSYMGRISTPYRMMAAAVTGHIMEDATPYNAAELITPLKALRCATINGAWQMGLENRCGSIEVGKSADFVVADNNILKCRKEDIEHISVTRTYFEGQLVYKSH